MHLAFSDKYLDLYICEMCCAHYDRQFISGSYVESWLAVTRLASYYVNIAVVINVTFVFGRSMERRIASRLINMFNQYL